MRRIHIYFFFLLLTTCTEPFGIETIDFENVLIVESILTNEMKQHTVKLSRTISLESAARNSEDQALVRIEGDDGHVYHFTQDAGSGLYLSDEEFQAKPTVAYVLHIDTKNGSNYVSKAVMLPTAVGIDRVYAEKVHEGGGEGINVYVDSEEANDQAQYFRYEFEATYKIVVPKPSNWDWTIKDYDFRSGFYELNLTRREPEVVCYSSYTSTGILQTSTAEFAQNRVMRFPLHHLYKGNPALRERYSIEAKQFVQSLEAFTFYKTLKDLGVASNLLTQGQPGFIPGNLVSTKNPNDKVFGFFDVSAVSKKRIYFNYKDFVFEFPTYFEDCTRTKILPTAALITKLEMEHYQIHDFEEDGPVKVYHIYKEACTDCTTFSSSEKPDFWKD